MQFASFSSEAARSKIIMESHENAVADDQCEAATTYDGKEETSELNMEHREGNMADEAEVPRTTLTNAEAADIAMLFKDLELDERDCQFLESATSEDVRLAEEEDLNSLNSSNHADEGDIIENTLAVPGNEREEQEAESSCGTGEICDSLMEENGRRVMKFLENLTANPRWARTVPYVKLYAAVPKDAQMALATHAYHYVNMRPKYLTMFTKNLDIDDLAYLAAFESPESANDVPLQRSFFRLYCRNAVPNLRTLLNTLTTITRLIPHIEIIYSEVLGEVKYHGTNTIAQAPDLKYFCRVEECGRALGMRFHTSFSCRSRLDPLRAMEIRYYDAVNAAGERETYLDLDHEATNRQDVGSETREVTFSVNAGKKKLAKKGNSPAVDLIEFIVRLTILNTRDTNYLF